MFRRLFTVLFAAALGSGLLGVTPAFASGGGISVGPVTVPLGNPGCC